MDDFLNIAKLNSSQPKKGRILLSEPFMEDDFFKRSVVLLCDHHKEGTFGFVLNHMLSVCLHEIMDGITAENFRIGFGGPVNSCNLYFIHSLGDKVDDCHEISKNIYTGGDFDQIKTLINTGVATPSEIRFFLGYSGWSAGQLDEELNLNSWIVSDKRPKDIIGNSNKLLWNDVLKGMGGKFKALANFPEDPTLN